MKTPRTVSARLADFASGLQWDVIPEEVSERAKHLMLDAIGCGLAARRFDFAPRALRAIADLAGPGERAVIGHAQRLPLRDAALANGLLMHGLDYDDTHTEGVVHLTVAVLPAVLALSSQLGRSGKDALCAYIAGVEAGARLGSVARGGFHQAGFHPTGVVGAFAAALAAGFLYRLSQEQLIRAQGVALSVASGSLEFLEDGAWTKRLHPGWAAVGGITAAAMARHDFAAPGAAYEGRFGLFSLYLKEEVKNLDRATRGLGGTWETMNVAVKPFPACHFVHAFADAGIALHRSGLKVSEIESIVALVPQEVVETVCEPVANKKRPANDYDARFSVPYVVAAGLIAGKLGLAELEERALRDPQILALASKVDYEIDPGSGFPQHYSGELIVRLADGRERRHREQVNRGAADRPLTNADIIAKFMENAGLAIPERRAHEIRNAVLSLEELADVRDLEALLADE